MRLWVWLLLAAFVALVIWAVGMHAEESAPLPQITVEQQRDYHRLRAALLATPQQRALDNKIAEMQVVCADRPLIADAKGDPTCGIAQPATKGN